MSEQEKNYEIEEEVSENEVEIVDDTPEEDKGKKHLGARKELRNRRRSI